MKQVPATTASIDAAIQALTNGGVVMHATETCYGLCCDLTNESAVRRLFAIKQRPLHQPVSALFTSIEASEQFVVWHDKARLLAAQYLPGPLTLLLPRRKGSPRLWLAPEGEIDVVGVRISSHPIAMAIAQLYPHPVSTTSANVHGQPEAYETLDALRQFEGMFPDLLLESGDLPATPPSTIVRVDESGILVVRQGSITV